MGHVIGLFIVRSLVSLSLRNYFFKVVVPICIVIAITFSVSLPIHFIMEESFLRLVLVTIISVAAAGLSLYFVAFDKNEKALALDLANGLMTKIMHKKNG